MCGSFSVPLIGFWCAVTIGLATFCLCVLWAINFVDTFLSILLFVDCLGRR